MKNNTQKDESNHLETLMQNICISNLDELQLLIKSSFENTNNRGVDYIVARCEFGYRAMQAKARLPHGKFTKWLKDSLGSDLAVRTGRRYIKTTEIILTFMLNYNSSNAISQRTKCYFAIKGIDLIYVAEEFADIEFFKELVSYIAQGFTQSQFAEILRSSNSLACEQEAKEESEKNQLDAPAKEVFNAPVPTQANGQLDFFSIMMKHTDSLEDAIDKGFIDNLDRDQLTTFASKLETQLKLVKDIIKNRID